MIKAKGIAVAAIALVTFLFIGAQMVWAFETWECVCLNSDCGWCGRETVCDCSHELDVVSDCACWVCYEDEAYTEYADAFTALFNSYETKWSKNGRLMIRQGDSGSFKFAKKGK